MDHRHTSRTRGDSQGSIDAVKQTEMFFEKISTNIFKKSIIFIGCLHLPKLKPEAIATKTYFCQIQTQHSEH